MATTPAATTHISTLQKMLNRHPLLLVIHRRIIRTRKRVDIQFHAVFYQRVKIALF
jgi:hypothetical protein